MTTAPAPDPTEPSPAASPLPPAPQPTIEDRLAALEKDVAELKSSDASSSLADLQKKLDDAGLLRAQLARAAGQTHPIVSG